MRTDSGKGGGVSETVSSPTLKLWPCVIWNGSLKIYRVAPPAVLGNAMWALAASGLAARMPTVVNTLVSNVPGPPFPLYTCGAKVTGIFSTSVIAEGMGLNITLFSYMDRIDFGLHVDPELVADPWSISDGFLDALAELMEAGKLGKPTVVEDPLGFDSGPRRTGA